MKSQEIVTSNLGICAQRARHYWRALPRDVQVHYGIEDMIEDVVLRVVRTAHTYKKGKALPSTWVYRVADNKCQDIMIYWQMHKRRDCATIQFCPEMEVKLIHPEDRIKLIESKNAIESVLEAVSDPLKHWLDGVLKGEPRKRPNKREVEELRSVIKRNSASWQDFRLVQKCLVS